MYIDFQSKKGASERTQKVTCLAHKADGLEWIPGSHIKVKGDNQLH